MGISEKDIKKLWGLAAGLCAHPGCAQDCVVFVDVDDPTVLGEMAHVIARKPRGPRGGASGGDDTYANLILLCPTHHRLVDKAPDGSFPEATLLQWKRDHEARVRNALHGRLYSSFADLARDILPLLQHNRQIWATYGPESQIALQNPVSTAAVTWNLRKLAVIIPNNRRIVTALQENSRLLTSEEYAIALEFVEHAEGFEASTYDRRDSVPRFPSNFGVMVDNAASK